MNLNSLKEAVENTNMGANKTALEDTLTERRKIIMDSRLRTLKKESSNFLSVDNSPSYKNNSKQFVYLNSQDDNDEEEDSKKHSTSSVFLKPFKFSNSDRNSRKKKMKASGGNDSNKSSRSSSKSDRSSDESHPSLRFSTRRSISKGRILLERFDHVLIYILQNNSIIYITHILQTTHYKASKR